MANYKVGDTVVCIDAKTLHENVVAHPTSIIIRGQKYIVHGFSGPCVTLEGQRYDGRRMRGICGSCRIIEYLDYWHYQQWRFIKLDGLLNDEGIELARELETQ